jgi:predicted Zn-dependent peptidase
VFCSIYPEEEIRHEVDVICDEIESYNDSPAELIYDEFENMIFQNHPLGHNILGTRERVLSFTSEDARRFTQRYYRPSNAIFFAYGDVDFPRMVKLLERCMEQIVERNVRLDIQPASSFPQSITTTVSQEHHQAHVMLGSKAYSYDDKRRMPLYLLNNLLGGPGMNARLNLSLREKNGLVYTVESAMASYSDTGCWSVYFGCDHHDVKRCLRLVHRELDKVMQHPLTERQLTAAKRQLKGQIAIACDNREQFALDIAKNYLHYGRERDINELLERIDAITASQIQEVAQELFAPERLQQLIL